VKYLDGNGSMEQDEGTIICVLRAKRNNFRTNLEGIIIVSHNIMS
jgi:hypothetical protein